MTNRMSRDQLSHSTDQKRSSPKKLTAPTLVICSLYERQ